MLSGDYESRGEEEKWEAKCSLLKFVAVRLPFSSDHMGYLHFFQFFVLSTNATITQSIEDQKKTYTKMNNCSINFNGSNMYDLWVIKHVRVNLVIRDGTSVTAMMCKICHPSSQVIHLRRGPEQKTDYLWGTTTCVVVVDGHQKSHATPASSSGWEYLAVTDVIHSAVM